MAPELFKIDNEEKYGPPTRESDVFAFGMVTFEVRNVNLGIFFHGFETLSCIFLGIHRTSTIRGV